MLTTLPTIKSSLGIDPFDLKNDAILTSALRTIPARFDKEINRTLARTVNTIDEFEADETEIHLSCYPLETATTFQLKQSEADGWVTQTSPDFLVRQGCIISLRVPFATWRPGSRHLHQRLRPARLHCHRRPDFAP